MSQLGSVQISAGVTVKIPKTRSKESVRHCASVAWGVAAYIALFLG